MKRSSMLTLIRHGEVDAHWRERIYGDLDVPLSECGEEQSRMVAARLTTVSFDAVVSSGLERAEFIAQLLRAARGLERRDDPRLREIDRGRWAGLDRRGVDAEQPGAWDRWWARGGIDTPPGGESLQAMRPRVIAGLDAAADLAPGGAVAVVAHKWVLRQAACAALDLELERCVEVEVPYVGVMELEWPSALGRAGGLAPRLLHSDGRS